MQFIKYDNALSTAGLAAGLANTPLAVDQYNGLVVALGAIRDQLRRPGTPPTVPYDGPLEALRAADTRVPVVGFTSPRDLDDALPAGNTATEQNRYLRAQYATAITALLEALDAQKQIGTAAGVSASAGLEDYSGQVAVMGDVEDVLVDPTRPSNTRVRIPVELAQLAQTLTQGMDAVGEQTRAAAEGRSVSATAQARAQAGLATAERLTKAEATTRAEANTRAVVIGAGVLFAAYLWSR